MTYFLCLAIPQETVPKLRNAFNSVIYLTEVTRSPIGKATIGKATRGKTIPWSEYRLEKHPTKNAVWSAYLLEINFGSAFLIGRGAVRKTHNNHRPQLLVEGIQALMSDDTCASLSLMYHWIPNSIENEQVIVKQIKEVKESNIEEWISYLEEDVRYVVSK